MALVFFYPSFEEDKRLCPVETLKVYELYFVTLLERIEYFVHLLANMVLLPQVPLRDG